MEIKRKMSGGALSVILIKGSPVLLKVLVMVNVV